MGFGDVDVHEVATDRGPDADLAYFAHYSGGIRVARFDATGIAEVAGFIDEDGNDLWGVQLTDKFVDGRRIVAFSDRDYVCTWRATRDRRGSAGSPSGVSALAPHREGPKNVSGARMERKRSCPSAGWPTKATFMRRCPLASSRMRSTAPAARPNMRARAEETIGHGRSPITVERRGTSPAE